MLWWLFTDEGRKDGCRKASITGGTKGIAFSLLHTFVEFSRLWCHQG